MKWLLWCKDSRDGELRVSYVMLHRELGGGRAPCKLTTGYIFTLAEGALSWRSWRQPTVALLSTKSEYRSIKEAVQAILWLRRMMEHMGYAHSNPTVIQSDNLGEINLTSESIFRSRTKHIEINYHFICEIVEADDLCLKQHPTQDMVADLFTKALAKNHFFSFLFCSFLCFSQSLRLHLNLPHGRCDHQLRLLKKTFLTGFLDFPHDKTGTGNLHTSKVVPELCLLEDEANETGGPGQRTCEKHTDTCVTLNRMKVLVFSEIVQRMTLWKDFGHGILTSNNESFTITFPQSPLNISLFYVSIWGNVCLHLWPTSVTF